MFLTSLFGFIQFYFCFAVLWTHVFMINNSSLCVFSSIFIILTNIFNKTLYFVISAVYRRVKISSYNQISCCILYILSSCTFPSAWLMVCAKICLIFKNISLFNILACLILRRTVVCGVCGANLKEFSAFSSFQRCPQLPSLYFQSRFLFVSYKWTLQCMFPAITGNLVLSRNSKHLPLDI